DRPAHGPEAGEAGGGRHPARAGAPPRHRHRPRSRGSRRTGRTRAAPRGGRGVATAARPRRRPDPSDRSAPRRPRRRTAEPPPPRAWDPRAPRSMTACRSRACGTPSHRAPPPRSAPRWEAPPCAAVRLRRPAPRAGGRRGSRLTRDGALQLGLVHLRSALDPLLLRFVVELVARAAARAAAAGTHAATPTRRDVANRGARPLA